MLYYGRLDRVTKTSYVAFVYIFHAIVPTCVELRGEHDRCADDKAALEVCRPALLG